MSSPIDSGCCCPRVERLLMTPSASRVPRRSWAQVNESAHLIMCFCRFWHIRQQQQQAITGTITAL